MQTQEIKHLATHYVLPLKIAGEGLQVKTHKTWILRDASGALTITIPQAMIGFAKDGDQVVVTLAFLKSEIVSGIVKATVIEKAN